MSEVAAEVEWRQDSHVTA